MLVPVLLGSDKTTTSVATGHTEFHPVYLGILNTHNTIRRAHEDAILPVAFLPIPKSQYLHLHFLIVSNVIIACREEEDSAEFRTFRKQLYHACLAILMQPLGPGMTTPEVVKCPDGRLRRAIFQIGPFIADYPEQVVLAGIVSGWCPKYVSFFAYQCTSTDCIFIGVLRHLKS